MQAKDYLKKIALSACIYYTAVTFLVLFLYWIINADLSRGVHPISLILFLPFSVCFAAANILYRHAKWGTALKVVIHYIFTLGGIWFFLFLPNKSQDQSASGALILFLIFSLIYIIIMTVILVVKSRANRVIRDESEYVSVYKNNDK